MAADDASRPLVSVVIPAFNAADDYFICLKSLAGQSVENIEVLWIDSCSVDGSADCVRRDFPWVRVVCLSENIGYRGGAQYGADQARGRHLIVLNQDVECDQRFIEHLLRPLEQDPTVGLVAPLILHFARRDLVNEVGNTFHFSGLYGSRGLDEPRQSYAHSAEIGIVSGCSFCIRMDLWRDLGGFSPDFEAYDTGFHAANEDQDLCWRARLEGFRVWLATESILYHKYVRKPWSGGRLNSYYFSYWLVLVRNFRWRSLALLAPFIGLNLGLLWLKAAAGGWRNLGTMWATQWWVWRSWRTLLLMRRRVQARRKVRDYAVVTRMETNLVVTKNRWAQALYNTVSSVYYQVFLALVRLAGA